MMSAEQNDLITRTGPGAPAGALLRNFWQPAALVEELEEDRPARPVRLLGEDLALFRDDAGAYRLIGRRCPHRGADLCYGRREDGGLRCPVHGWLIDGEGRCLEQPAEPEGSRFHDSIRHPAYPCVERNGIIFAYMGPGEPPAFPELDCLRAPDSHSFAFKGFVDCNWLQVLEIGIDPAHASYLHRFLEDEDPSEGYGQQFRDTADRTEMPMTKILRDFSRPKIEVEETVYGLRLTALRDLGNHGMHVRVTNQVFPQAIVIPMSNAMTITQWHVPVDDTTSYWYAMFTSFTDPVDRAVMRAQRLELYELPDYVPRIGKANDYGFDPAEQRDRTYTGMGADINVHDQWAVESMGAIQDRTTEQLGRSDVGIIAYRRLLRRAIEAARAGEGAAVPFRDPATAAEVGGPIAIDTVSTAANWRDEWITRDRERRLDCPWAAA